MKISFQAAMCAAMLALAGMAAPPIGAYADSRDLAERVSRPAQEPPMRWMFNSFAFADIKDDPIVQRYFNTDRHQLLVIGRQNEDLDIPEKNLHSIRSFTNYAAIERAFAEHTIGRDVDLILYDNEVWKFTPEEEQRDPARYTRMAADLVHKHGLRFISAPAANLAKVLLPNVAKRYDGYLESGLAADSARYADIYEIQAQGSELDLANYTRFVSESARQARQANPKVIVLAGISTNPSGQKVTSDGILDAIGATRSVVEGYWFNIPRHSAYCPRCNEYRPDMAIDVFRRLMDAR